MFWYLEILLNGLEGDMQDRLEPMISASITVNISVNINQWELVLQKSYFIKFISILPSRNAERGWIWLDTSMVAGLQLQIAADLKFL